MLWYNTSIISPQSEDFRNFFQTKIFTSDLAKMAISSFLDASEWDSETSKCEISKVNTSLKNAPRVFIFDFWKVKILFQTSPDGHSSYPPQREVFRNFFTSWFLHQIQPKSLFEAIIWVHKNCPSEKTMIFFKKS